MSLIRVEPLPRCQSNAFVNSAEILSTALRSFADSKRAASLLRCDLLDVELLRSSTIMRTRCSSDLQVARHLAIR